MLDQKKLFLLLIEDMNPTIILHMYLKNELSFYFHSKKREYIVQEIWARLILYNFCEIITSNVTIEKCTKKHAYQINYTFAIHICRYFISKMAEKSPPDVETLISKEILSVRPGRHDPRKVAHKKAVCFLYRVA